MSFMLWNMWVILQSEVSVGSSPEDVGSVGVVRHVGFPRNPDGPTQI